jgi:hypothetical protein
MQSIFILLQNHSTCFGCQLHPPSGVHAPQRYPYFDVVVGLPMPDRSRVMTQTKMDTLVLQVGGFGVGLTTPHSKKLIITKVEQRKKLDGFNDDGESWSQIGNNGRILFDRPKPTAGCSASGRRRRSGVHEIVTTASDTGHSICATTSLQRGRIWPRCTDTTTCTGGCSYNFMYS